MRTWPALVISGAGPGDSPVDSYVVSASPSESLRAGTRTLASSELVQAALLDYELTAIEELTDDSCRAFFSTPAMRDAALTALHREFPGWSLERVDVADDDWAARSQANLRSIQIGRIVVAPPWDVPAESDPPGGSTEQDPPYDR